MNRSAVPAWLLLLVLSLPLLAADDQPFGMDRRIPWTTSRVVGSPDPPLPYSTEQTYTNIQFKAPLYVAREPDSDFLLVVLQGGEKDRPSKILRVRDDPASSEAEIFLQMTNRLIYSVGFHPGFRTNGWLFVFSNGPTPEQERTNRISRFIVQRQPHPLCDPASETRIIEWRSAGHDGGDMVFGLDGMLYLSTGDGTTDSDTWDSGQTVNDLLGSVLRIDVDRPEPGKLYSVPRDNPFVALKDARPEIWAYGLRNPWRMTIDAKTGRIWVGNNGQDLWETAHLIRPGENYGWSVYEGNHPFYLNRKRGPTPHVPPTIEHPHSEMRSLTGGVVYYGDEFPELSGAYIYGDYSTGQIWEARHNGSKLTSHKKLAQTRLQIASFALDHRGGILIIDHGGAIHRLTRSARKAVTSKFPKRLSETGIFVSTRDHQIAPGIIPYSIVAPGWADGAHAERFIGVPNHDRIEYKPSEGWEFTNGAVLIQTLSLALQPNDLTSRRRIETRLLTKQDGQWVGYSYRWNKNQTDATLVPAQGEEIALPTSGKSKSRQVWRFPSRDECMGCHSRAANFVLGVSEAQMNRDHIYHDGGAVPDNQIRALEHIGMFTKEPKSSAQSTRAKLVDPYNPHADLEARARSWLHVNCSVCHVEAGGGNARMELGINRALDRMNLIEARPQHQTFGIDNAMLVAPGDPKRSVLLERISRRGSGQMPPLVIKTVDEKAVALFRGWIAGLPPQHQFVEDWKMDDLLPALDRLKGERSLDSGRNAYRQAGCAQCHRLSGSGGSVGPDLTGVGQRLSPRDLLESILLPSNRITEGYASSELELTSDEIITGFVEREDDQSIVFRPVTAADNPVTIPKKKVARRTFSQLSNMPAGIANTLTRDQILDLLAYLISPDQKSGTPE